MHPQIQSFHRPERLEDAVAILRDPAAAALIVAGATEVGLRVRSTVRSLVDISRLGLDTVWEDDDGLHLGAMVRATRIARDPAIQGAVGHALPESAFAIASETIRNLTSLGGNVVHLTSWSDMPPALHVLGARFRVQGTRDRLYDAEELFSGQPRRLLEPGDILTEIVVPPLAPRTGSAFIKHAKTAVDFAYVNAAALVVLAEDGETVEDVRISVGAIHTPPIRVTDAEAALRGQPIDPARLQAVAAATAAQVRPRRDARASDEYLRHCAGVIVKRSIAIAADRAAGSDEEGDN